MCAIHSTIRFQLLIITFCTIVPSFYSLSPAKTAARTTDYEQRSCPFVKGLHANLIRFITLEGFHRDLEDTLEVTVTTSSIPIQSFTSGECIFGLLHEFSKDVFVDPYEIQRNPALTNYIRVLNNWTDLESPAWLAKSNSTVFIQLTPILTGNLISTEPISLPIHYRYQLPRSHSRNRVKTTAATLPGAGMLNPAGYVTVTLPLPEIILRCDRWDSAILDQCKTVPIICHRKAPLNEKCHWVLLPYKSNLKSGSVHIPMGDTDNKFLITAVTAGVVGCGMLLLIGTLLKAKNRLHEQRQNISASAIPHPHRD